MHRYLKGEGVLSQVAEQLKRDVLSNSLVELERHVTRQAGTGEIHLLVFERYYMRVSNRASLTVMLSQNGREIGADAIGSGAGQGAFFSLSWGTEEDFVNMAVLPLKEMGFTDA